MSGPVQKVRRGRLLAGGGAGALALVFLALVSVLASLALSAMLVAGRGPAGGHAGLVGAATVVVRAAGLESADAAAARAVEILSARPEVARAWAQYPAGGDALAARVIDGRASGGEPRLIAVDFRPGVAGSPRALVAGLVRTLAAEGVEAAGDDHRIGSGPLERARIAAALLCAAIVLCAALIVALVCAGAARRRALTQWRTVDMLRLCGADDGFVAGLFVGGAARAAVGAGLAGAALAAAALLLVRAAPAWTAGAHVPGTVAQLMPSLVPGLLIVAAWPPIAALAGALAARLALARVLAHTP